MDRDDSPQFAPGQCRYESYFIDVSRLGDGAFLTRFSDPRFGEGWVLYDQPDYSKYAYDISEVASIIEQVEEWSCSGYCAGFVAYEAAPAFDPAYTVKPSMDRPLCGFHFYRSRPKFYKEIVHNDQTVGIPLVWNASLSRDGFDHAFDQIHGELAIGSTYQVNFTYQLEAQPTESIHNLFVRCAAEDTPPYASLFLSEQISIASLSPELFFEWDGKTVRCRPMKGTARMGSSLVETSERIQDLQQSPKERAENLMVVDMIRNDLGRIADVGSVNVPRLFEVERFGEVLQMTSDVEAKFQGSLTDLFSALFPCASIVGAPKVQTMKIIERLEADVRGVYTGAIGFVGPDGKARFSVAIRTVSQAQADKPLMYGVGSGIVWDSTCDEEWSENQLKTTALSKVSQDWRLFETIRWPQDPDHNLLPLHLARIHAAARFHGISFNPTDATKLLNELPDDSALRRVRLSVDRRGELRLESAPYNPLTSPIRAKLAQTPVCAQDPSLHWKSNRRKIYDMALEKAGTEEVLLWNDRLELTEFSKGNVLLEIDGVLYTPPQKCGLLAGTHLMWMLERRLVQERVLMLSDLSHCERIYRINGLSGQIEVEFDLEPGPKMR